MKTIKVMLNVTLLGIPKGSVITLGTKKYPLSGFWGRRLRDSKIDHCLTIIDEEQTQLKTKKKEVLKNVD